MYMYIFVCIYVCKIYYNSVTHLIKIELKNYDESYLKN